MFRHVVVGLTFINVILTTPTYKYLQGGTYDYHKAENVEDYLRKNDFHDLQIPVSNRDEYEPPSDSFQSREMKEALADLPKNGELFEGDIQMDQRLKDAVLGISKKSALRSENILWPNGVLYYVIDKSFVPKARELLKEAMIEFERRTCITFKKRTTEPDYVIYTSKKNICSSNIGRIGGPQQIFIGAGCVVLGTVEHETMHSLGFIHEHSRPDRDSYVKVMWDNIEKREWANFNKYTVHDVKNMNVDYNYASVMHYRNDAFTKNGDDTLIAQDEPSLKFGQRIKFSEGDIKEINLLYKCPQKDGEYNGLFKSYSGQKKDIIRRLRYDKRLFEEMLYSDI